MTSAQVPITGMTVWLEDDPRPLDWNGPTDRPFASFRDDDLDRPIIEHFERVARRQRDCIAVRDADGDLTFGELWNSVSGLADTLATETRPGGLVGILMPACPMFPIAMLACLATGRPFIALNPHDPPDWLDDVLRDARPALILTHEDGSSGVEARTATVRVLRLTGVPDRAREGWRPTRTDVDEPACILLTSGSTGRPKTIVNSQRNLLQRVAQSINAAHISSADRMLTLASPSTIVAVRDILTALLAGAGIHLLDPQAAGTREILNAIRADAVTILFAFPTLLRSIAARATPAEVSLRLVRVGGDTTSWSDIASLRAWLAPEAFIQLIYAATEAPMMQWFVDEGCRGDDVRVPIGYPLPGNRLALVDDEGRSVPGGEVGELIVTSPYVSLGGWFEGRLAGEGDRRRERVFRTGDLARQRPDGLLDRVGRRDRQVKIRGSRVDLDGVDARLREHPCVCDVATVARPGSADGTTTLVAYVNAREGASPGLIGELQSLMRTAPPPLRPARFYVVPSIPRLPNSKLDIHGLTALDEARGQYEREESIAEVEHASIAGDHFSQVLARAWQDVLGVPVRGGEEDFFDSGGDSLKAIALVLELERTLGFEISLTLINETPRFDQLCQALRERRPPGSTPLVTLKAGDSLPPVFFIHGVGGNVMTFLPTARQVTYPGAVIGIRARGVVRGEAPHASIEAMATDYLREIKACQPNGPYYLCGYSSGGLVAFEIARRLSESGDDVGLVGLFDTRMSSVRRPLRAWLSIANPRLAARRLRAWRDTFTGAPFNAVSVVARSFIAAAKYHPGFYRGQLTLFAPAEREPGLPSLESTWRAHARTIVVVETAGTHSTMLSASNAECAAASLTRCLRVCSAAIPTGVDLANAVAHAR